MATMRGFVKCYGALYFVCIKVQRVFRSGIQSLSLCRYGVEYPPKKKKKQKKQACSFEGPRKP